MNNFTVRYVPWWRPVRLAKWDAEHQHFDFIGWVWRQRAYLVNNLNHGWVAFIEDQTPENLAQKGCPGCGRILKDTP